MEKNVDQSGGRAQKRAETITRILDETHRLLREEGYSALSMRSLASHLGMRLSNVQYYFPQLKDILIALFTRFVEKDVGAFRTEFDQATGTPEVKLRRAVEALLLQEDYLKECNLFMSKLIAAGHGDQDVAQAIGRYYEGYRSAAIEIVNAFEPALSEAEKAEKAYLMVAMIEGFLRVRETMSIAAHHSRLEDTLTSGLLKIVRG